uniref:Uncharacterized protein n=1 Tax=Anguilla anguilla TaxID=7936 RepID=A0A0E9R418_ANGAN
MKPSFKKRQSSDF